MSQKSLIILQRASVVPHGRCFSQCHETLHFCDLPPTPSTSGSVYPVLLLISVKGSKVGASLTGPDPRGAGGSLGVILKLPWRPFCLCPAVSILPPVFAETLPQQVAEGDSHCCGGSWLHSYQRATSSLQILRPHLERQGLGEEADMPYGSTHLPSSFSRAGRGWEKMLHCLKGHSNESLNVQTPLGGPGWGYTGSRSCSA